MLSSTIIQKGNIDMSDISKNSHTHTHTHTQSVVNLNLLRCQDNKDVIMVKHHKKQFTFFDHSNSLIGSFTIEQLFKYVGDRDNGDFMPLTEIGISNDIIETFIVKCSNKDLTYNIELVSHNSPFMGNIEMIIKLNNNIREFEKKDLNSYLDKINDTKTRRKISNCINEFIFLLLSHSLKLTSTVSEQIKNDLSRKDIKETLLRYSCSVTYRISHYVLDQLDSQDEYITNLEHNLNNLIDIKTSLNKKIDSLESTIQVQNNRVQTLVTKLDSMLLNNAKIEPQPLLNQNSNNNNNDHNDNNGNNNHTDVSNEMFDITDQESPTSNIIEEIFNLNTKQKKRDISEVFDDSENAYQSGSETNNDALNYISDNDNNNNNIKTNKLEISGIYNV